MNWFKKHFKEIIGFATMVIKLIYEVLKRI